MLRRLTTLTAAGFICGLLAVVLGIGNATLIARGDLAPLVTAFVAVSLMAAAIQPAITAFLSAIPGQVTTTQEVSVVALIPVVGAAAAVAGPADSPGFLATLLVTMGLATFAGGAVMWALGWAGWGRIIRFVPYPVFGGFLAVTGWYLLVGGLETAVSFPLHFDEWGRLLEPGNALKAGAAIVFVALVYVFDSKVPAGALLPLASFAAIVVFNVVAFFGGFSLETLQQTGWVITVPVEGVSWPPVGLDEFALINWSAVMAGMLIAPLAIIVTVAGAMMNASSIELELKGDLDLNRELRSMGIGNALAGLAGGIPGYPAVSGTLLAVRLGAADRLVGIAVGLVCLAAVLFAPQLLGIVPAPLLGALLMSIGASLFIDWVIKPFRTLPFREYGIIFVILGVSIVLGFGAGIVTGIIFSLLLFVFEYSRIDGIRFAATGREYHSRSLPDDQRTLMQEKGDAIVIMKLSGFLFFGTSDRIVQQVTSRIADAPHLQTIVMDFRRVSGVDSSTVLSFQRLARLAEKHGVAVVLASVHGDTLKRFLTGGLALDSAPFRLEADLDDGVAWAEAQLLGQGFAGNGGRTLAGFLGSEDMAGKMRGYLELASFAPEARLIEQDSAADDVFFVEEGEGKVLLEGTVAGDPVTLLAFGPGTILGEVAFYTGEVRSASAVASKELKAWRLTRAALARIEKEAPELAAVFHQQVAKTLAGRLQSANRLIRVLVD